jgi:hypothetical protein
LNSEEYEIISNVLEITTDLGKKIICKNSDNFFKTVQDYS